MSIFFLWKNFRSKHIKIWFPVTFVFITFFYLSLFQGFSGFLVQNRVDYTQPGRYGRSKNRVDSTPVGCLWGLNWWNLLLFFRHVIANFKVEIFEFFFFLPLSPRAKVWVGWNRVNSSKKIFTMCQTSKYSCFRWRF